MKYEIKRGDTLWTLWADLFLLWQEHGNCRSQADCDEWYITARELESKYAQTEEKDLCQAILITMGEVIDKRILNDKQKNM